MKQIVIISGKGGTGKTVICASFASLAKNKVMADCDVDAADLHLLLHPDIKERHEFRSGKKAYIDQEKCIQCGKCLSLCRFNVIEASKDKDGNLKKIFIDPVSCEGCGVCFHTCPVDAIEMREKFSGEWFISETKYGPMVHAKLGIAEENSGKLVALVRQKARQIAEKKNCDWVIIDGAPGIGCPVIASLSGIDCAVVVTEPTLSGLHDAKRVIEVARHFGVAVKVIINKFDLNFIVTKKIEDFCQDNSIELLGKVSYDEFVVKALVEGKTILEYPDGKAKKEISSIWENLKNGVKK